MDDDLLLYSTYHLTIFRLAPVFDLLLRLGAELVKLSTHAVLITSTT